MVMNYPIELCQEMKRVIAGENPKFNLDFIGTQRSLDLWPEYLRYCPECAREDAIAFGETYWHRAHQLPGMAYCTKHFMRLADSRIPMRKTTTTFYPASNEIVLENTFCDFEDELKPYKEKFLMIGRDSEWLLNNGTDIEWDFDFHSKYKRLLREKNIVTVQGVSDYDLIAKQFNDYWDVDFLESLYFVMSDTRDWIRQIQAARIMTFKPIYHILLIRFLKGSIKEFLEYDPPENPFGEGPWLCENPVCSHYQIDVCRNTEIRFFNGIATGFFQCDDCGMVYKRTQRKGKTGDIIIVDYGHVWKDEFLLCFETKKMTIQETASFLRCKPSIVSFQRKKMGLLKKNEYLKTPLKYDAEIGAENYYKAQVLKLCEQYDEVTTAMLKEHAPEAYSYLRKNYISWLQNRVVYERESVCREEFDRGLLKKVRNAVDIIKKEGDEKRQLTKGYIASVAKENVSVLYCTEQTRPLTKAFLDDVVENRADWLRRRINMIGSKQKKAGKPLSLADVKREMSIKPNTYIKYKNLIEEIIDGFNK